DSIGLNVFVSTAIASRTDGSLPASHSPIQVSLRPPPYASAVSNVLIPSSHAASMIRNASSCAMPWPKNAGEEPTPPKFPQPRTIRVTETPLRPSSLVSTYAASGAATGAPTVMRAGTSTPRSGPTAQTTNTPPYPTADAIAPRVRAPTRKPSSVKALNVPTTELRSLAGPAFTASVIRDGNASACP